MKKLAVSVLAKFEGLNPKDYWPCDSYIGHMEPDKEETPHLQSESQTIRPEDSEWDSELWTRNKIVPVDEETGEERPVEGEEYDELREVTVTGIVSFTEAMRYLDHIGAIYEDCETMGTLGGPLSGGFPSIVPDMPFNIESQLVVASIRITPFIIDTEAKCICAMREATWDRIRELFRKHDGYALAKMGARSFPHELIEECMTAGCVRTEDAE